ncbi:hypothetical protein M975_2616 [Buttiauxella brennerae ATCC 51605]|uniref:Transport permease protein n=1 Tax=Buttiauxella brennerae ATCC 51605 TaxID=1354251 RepID=A0A1B7INP3_9ENTR|nr:ABC transporter permease [Buttiauxella brennerae]OAT31285.1 hypothetical protein M975_2616 [Buttiauxella brennerae ATCC 51605]
MSSPGYWLELIQILTRKEISVRYKSSVLGYFWSVANPLMFGLIYYVVFKETMRVPVANYPLFLLCGLFAWQWMTAVIGNATTVFLANSVIIRKMSFPRGALPVSQVLMEGGHFLCALPVIVLLMLIMGQTPSLAWVWGVPLMWFLQALFLTGIAWTVASLTPFVRDLERFISLGLMALFYASPILYTPQMLPQRWQWVLHANPLAPFILAWRDLLMNGHLSGQSVAILFTLSFFSLLIGGGILHCLSPRLAEIL